MRESAPNSFGALFGFCGFEETGRHVAYLELRIIRNNNYWFPLEFAKGLWAFLL